MAAPLYQRILAEALGTFLLVAVGTGAIALASGLGGLGGSVAVAVAFGLVVFGAVWSLGRVSGAHINPAVTFGFVLARGLPPGVGALYVVGQSVGAVAASVAIAAAFPGSAGLAGTHPQAPLPLVFGLEVAGTFVLMHVILSRKRRTTASPLVTALAIGGVIFGAALFMGPLTGGSLNPARSLGPALVSGQLGALWLYVVAPPLGAYGAVLTCRMLKRADDCCTTPAEVMAA